MVLEHVSPNVRVERIIRGRTKRQKIDRQSIVGVDRIAADRVACAVQYYGGAGVIERDAVPGAWLNPTHDVARTIENHAIEAVPERERARGVCSDDIAFDDIA